MAKTWLAVCLLGALAGCYGMVGVEPTDVSTVKAGSSRTEVEAVLGTPIESGTVEGYRVDVYGYNAGSTGSMPGPIYDFAAGVAVLMIYMTPIPHVIEYEGQRVYLAVWYSADDKIVGYHKSTDKEAILEQTGERIRFEDARRVERIRLEGARRAYESQLRLRAEAGDSEAQYEMAQLVETKSAEQLMWTRLAAHQGHAEAQFDMAQLSESGSAEQSMWTCLAAHRGHAEAQHQMGQFHDESADSGNQDLVAAYVWYSLAEVNGFWETGSEYRKTTAGGWACCFPTRTRREILAEQLGPVQTAEAERLVAVWQPNLATCETIAAQAKE